MELVPYLITLAAGFGAGIWIESRYGAKLSQFDQQAHAKLDEIKAMIPSKPAA